MYQRMSESRSEQYQDWRGRGGGHQRREESVQHNLHKPSHLSLRNKFFKVLCEWNGL